MASSLTQLSACVTRILSLTGFPKELKTRDIQTAFSEWENVGGGFKIKWIDDTSLLIVFQDATVGELSAFHNQAGADTPSDCSKTRLSPRTCLSSSHSLQAGPRSTDADPTL